VRRDRPGLTSASLAAMLVWWLATPMPVYAGLVKGRADPVMYYTAWVLMVLVVGALLFAYFFVGLIVVSWVAENTVTYGLWPGWAYVPGLLLVMVFAPVAMLIGAGLLWQRRG